MSHTRRDGGLVVVFALVLTLQAAMASFGVQAVLDTFRGARCALAVAGLGPHGQCIR